MGKVSQRFLLVRFPLIQYQPNTYRSFSLQIMGSLCFDLAKKVKGCDAVTNYITALTTNTIDHCGLRDHTQQASLPAAGLRGRSPTDCKRCKTCLWARMSMIRLHSTVNGQYRNIYGGVKVQWFVRWYDEKVGLFASPQLRSQCIEGYMKRLCALVKLTDVEIYLCRVTRSFAEDWVRKN